MSMSVISLFSTTNPKASMNRVAKAGASNPQLLDSKPAVAKQVSVGDSSQARDSGMPVGEQAIAGCTTCFMDVSDGELTMPESQCAQLPVAPHAMVEQRLVVFDLLRFKQLGTDVASGANEREIESRTIQSRIIRGSQVVEDPSADMDALAYIEGYSAVAMESVGARGMGEVASERA
ncbi:hypothetical protein AXG53_08015 [Stenotrophomonas sp. KCTC 12332]|nr:hypothetical protein AXG53_08015 [Stenotrophomonas sp. KCTC 12332]